MMIKTPAYQYPHRATLNSAALIVVLGAVAFLSVIVVAFTVAMKMERQEAHYYAARASADLMASYGVETVRASLITACAPTNLWASSPGLVVYAPRGATTFSMISLFSSSATNGSGVYAPYDLNHVAITDDKQPIITGAFNSGSLNMKVGWIYVFQNGTVSTNQAPVFTASNPVIGRFAYWADDESSRININTSWTRLGNITTPSHPSWISLDGLFGTSLVSVIAGSATNNPFISVDMLRQLSASGGSATTLPDMVATNRFSLSASSFSPMLNPFGNQKIVLTTQASLANGMGMTNYLNILSTPNTDPGVAANISTTGVANAISNLTSVLSTNLPYFNTSYAQKYYPNNTNRITQLAIDIIEYVRACESTNLFIEPIRGAWNGGTFDTTKTTLTNTFIGTGRHPVITQMAVWMTNSATTNSIYSTPFLSAKAYITVTLPSNYGMDQCTSSVSVTLQDRAASLSRLNTTNLFNALPFPGNDGAILPSNAAITKGNSYVIAANFAYKTNTPPPTGTIQALRVALMSPLGSGQYFEIVPTIQGYAVDVPITVSSTPPTLGQSMQVAETSDPRVNKNPAAWSIITGTLGGPQMRLVSAATSPPQDTDSSGAISRASLVMPKVKGQSGALGILGSVAELGYITTGVETSMTNAASAGYRVVPWRSLRLQPTPSSTAVSPPDWALLDFFIAPMSTNNPSLYRPRPNMVAGKINVNSGGAFTGGPLTNNPAIVRTAPLLALFQAATGTLTVSANAITNNIPKMTLATGGTNYGIPIYVSPGELAEVAGVADSGEAAEANLQNVVDLATARSAVFRVYAVGQALQQTPGTSPSFLILSEQYKEAIVSYEPQRSGPRTLLWKNIAP